MPRAQVAQRAIEGGVVLLLLLIPWHDLLVKLWRPLGAWDDAVVLFLIAALIVRGPSRLSLRLALPLAAMLAAGLLSVAVNGMRVWSLRDALEYTVVLLAAAQVEPARIGPLLRRLVMAAGVAAVFGIVSYVSFRAAGGALGERPAVESAAMRFLTWPYYCGVYPRGEHLIGPFLNDLYFGVWLVAILAIAWAVWRPGDRLTAACALVMGVAAAWTFERTVVLTAVVSGGFLAVRASPRVLLAIAAATAAALPLVRANDRYRFDNPTAGNEGRFAMIGRAVETLAGGPFFGHGPGTVRLSDCQYARWVYETGWPGTLALCWFMAAILGPAFRRGASRLTIGLGAAVLALVTGGFTSEIWEVPQSAYTLWILAGLLYAAAGQDSRVAD